MKQKHKPYGVFSITMPTKEDQEKIMRDANRYTIASVGVEGETVPKKTCWCETLPNFPKHLKCTPDLQLQPKVVEDW